MYACKMQISRTTTGGLFAVFGGFRIFLVFFNRTFVRGYLNKVTCFVKICEFIYLGKKTEKTTFKHALPLFQEGA